MHDKLIEGKILENVYFTEPLNLHDFAINREINFAIIIRNSTLKAINGECLEFNATIELENCEIESISFHGVGINNFFSMKNCQKMKKTNYGRK